MKKTFLTLLVLLTASLAFADSLPSTAQTENYSFISDYVNKSTNELFWDYQNPAHKKCKIKIGNKSGCLNKSRFVKAVREFFDNQKNAYSGRKDLISDYMLDLLGGPPEQVMKLENGYITAAACRAHSCPEHGIVIYDPTTNSIAFAMLHYFLEEKAWQKKGYVTVFIKEDAPDNFANETITLSKKWQDELVHSYADSKYFTINPEFRIERIP